MTKVNHAQDRGKANFGWLDSRHTFSFGRYYDPEMMGYSALRVINDDKVKPTAGFTTHGHQDMEIISYVLEGEIAHKDSEGNVKTLPAGEFQLMSAGSGIMHSEFNPSQSDGLRFLQIWVVPNETGGKPGYQQKDFGQEPGLTLIVSADGRKGSLRIKQDAQLFQVLLESQADLQLPVTFNRHYYLHVIEGSLSVQGLDVHPGDGVEISGVEEIVVLAADSPVRALLFDLP